MIPFRQRDESVQPVEIIALAAAILCGTSAWEWHRSHVGWAIVAGAGLVLALVVGLVHLARVVRSVGREVSATGPPGA